MGKPGEVFHFLNALGQASDSLQPLLDALRCDVILNASKGRKCQENLNVGHKIHGFPLKQLWEKRLVENPVCMIMWILLRGFCIDSSSFFLISQVSTIWEDLQLTSQASDQKLHSWPQAHPGSRDAHHFAVRQPSQHADTQLGTVGSSHADLGFSVWMFNCSMFFMEFCKSYPLVNVYITMENHHAINGKIHYKWPFSIAMLVHQRVTFPTFFALIFQWDQITKSAGTIATSILEVDHITIWQFQQAIDIFVAIPLLSRFVDDFSTQKMDLSLLSGNQTWQRKIHHL